MSINLKSLWPNIFSHISCKQQREQLAQRKNEVEKFELSLVFKGKRVVIFKPKDKLRKHRVFAILVDQNEDESFDESFDIFFQNTLHYYVYGSSIGNEFEARYNLMLIVNGKNKKVN